MITCEFEPRFRDTDQVGHVNNAVFATYFELVRYDWLKKIHKLHPEIKIPFIIAKVEIEYLSPIYLRDSIEGQMWVEHIGNKSWSFGYSLKKVGGDIEFARGKTIQVAFDYTENQSIAINDEIRSILTPYLIDH